MNLFIAFQFLIFFVSNAISLFAREGIPLYYWREPGWTNFGDLLSVKIVERIIGGPVEIYRKNAREQKLLAVGSIFYFANEGDVVWGSGLNGKTANKESYAFESLDIRSVRGPLTREFFQEHFGIEIPEIYGDPALLLPYLFPEFQKNPSPEFDYIVIPHFSDHKYFLNQGQDNLVFVTEPWDVVINKILNSRFVISSSLHGVIVAEAFGIPARLLRVSEKEPLLKFFDYYLGTNRPNFEIATSVEEALGMGGEPPPQCDLEKIFSAFPFDYWPNATFYQPKF